MAHEFRDLYSPTIFFLNENGDPDDVNHLCPEPATSEASTQQTESHWIDQALDTLAMGHWAQQSMDEPADSDLAWLRTVPSIQTAANQIEAEDGYTPASNSGAHETSTTPAMVTESNENTTQPQTSSYQHDTLSVAWPAHQTGVEAKEFLSSENSSPKSPARDLADSCKTSGSRVSNHGPIRCKWNECTYGGTFSRKYDLFRHIEALHLEKNSLKCSVEGCPRKFSRQDNMFSHVRRVHS